MSPFLQTWLLLLILSLTSVNADIATGLSGCPGVYFAETSSTGCCVGGTLAPAEASICIGLLTCTSSATTATLTTPVSCAAVITQGPDWYDSIYSASVSLVASGTNYVTTVGGDSVPETGSSAASNTSPGVATATSAGGAMELGIASEALGGVLLGLLAFL